MSYHFIDEDRLKLRFPVYEKRKFKGFVFSDFLLGKPMLEAKKDVMKPEQCTGLKDKNGNLIYEGDILKPSSNSIKKQVIYYDGCFWAKDVIYFHDACHIYQRWIDECVYEIIGNIHENPKLLDIGNNKND